LLCSDPAYVIILLHPIHVNITPFAPPLPLTLTPFTPPLPPTHSCALCPIYKTPINVCI